MKARRKSSALCRTACGGIHAASESRTLIDELDVDVSHADHHGQIRAAARIYETGLACKESLALDDL